MLLFQHAMIALARCTPVNVARSKRSCALTECLWWLMQAKAKADTAKVADTESTPILDKGQASGKGSVPSTRPLREARSPSMASAGDSS